MNAFVLRIQAFKKSRFGKSLLWFVVIDLAAVALVIVGLLLTGIRIGVDVQRLIGEPACMPSLIYLWHKPNQVEPKVGNFVVARMKDSGLGLGARQGDRIVKKVMAGPGDLVRISGTELWINGVHTDRLWLAKSIPGKSVGDFDRDGVLNEGEFFLMGTTHESFDSRYWGPLNRESIIGYAIPLL